MAQLATPHYGGSIDLSDTNDPRSRIVNLVAPSSRALEIGCGSGTIIGYLAKEKSCRALAVEPDPAMAAAARALGVEVMQGNIQDASVLESLGRCSPVDVIIFADVLEHLRDPWSTLRQVRPWLAPGGAVVASVPNVAHWSLRLSLLAGHWEYTDGYLMDRTHLRWFTRRTVQDLFKSTGFRITDSQVRWAPLPGDRLWHKLVPGRTRAYAALGRLWPGLFGYQFIIRAEPE